MVFYYSQLEFGSFLANGTLIALDFLKRKIYLHLCCNFQTLVNYSDWLNFKPLNKSNKIFLIRQDFIWKKKVTELFFRSIKVLPVSKNL